MTTTTATAPPPAQLRAGILIGIAAAHLRLALRYSTEAGPVADVGAALAALELARAELDADPKPQGEMKT